MDYRWRIAFNHCREEGVEVVVWLWAAEADTLEKAIEVARKRTEKIFKSGDIYFDNIEEL